MRYLWGYMAIALFFVALVVTLPLNTRISSLNTLGSQEILQSGLPAALCSENQRVYCVTRAGIAGFRACENGRFSAQCYIANIDDCNIGPELKSNVCCTTESNVLYECNTLPSFSSGQYIIVKLNIQKAMLDAGLGWESYKICGFSKLIPTDSQVPEHFKATTAFSDSNAKVSCSSLFYTKHFHQASSDGYVPDEKGRVKLVEWRVFPSNVDVSSTEAVYQNYDKSASIFSYEVNVA